MSEMQDDWYFKCESKRAANDDSREITLIPPSQAMPVSCWLRKKEIDSRVQHQQGKAKRALRVLLGVHKPVIAAVPADAEGND